MSTTADPGGGVPGAESPPLMQLLVAHAAELARAGRHREAERVLGPALAAVPPMFTAIDLLARVRAQQGRLAEAEELWGRVAEGEPSDSAAAAALRRVRQALAHPGWWAVRRLPAGALLTLLVVGGALLLWSHRTGAPSPPNAPAPAVSTASMVAPVGNGQGARTVALPPIDVRGAAVRSDGDVVAITFEEPLFRRGVLFARPGTQALPDLGRQLGGHGGCIEITVVGQSDTLPMPTGARYRDNAALELARAAAVFDALRSAGDLPADAFKLEASPRAAGVAPARSRTAEIRLRWTCGLRAGDRP